MSAEAMPQLIAAGETHQGCVRRHNEDNFFFMSLFPGYCIAAVTDGVGGHSGGEVASYLCCHRLLTDAKKFFKNDPAPDDAAAGRFLVESVLRANKDIYAANRERKRPIPMCTTLAVTLFTPQIVIVVHVGDSRVYCLRNNSALQLTVDHTVQNELVESGVTDPDQLPGSHVISKAVGPDFHLKPEIHTYFRKKDDKYLLCSDGLTCYWSDQEIAEVLKNASTPRQANDRFIRDTLRKGAADNITVVSVFPENS